MVRKIQQHSEVTLDRVEFQWKISNFSFADLLEKVFKSPSFRSFNTDFHLELSRCERQVLLQLVSGISDDQLRISDCETGFYFSILALGYYDKKHAPTVKHTDIVDTIPIDLLERDCVANNTLRVGCRFTASTLKHLLGAQPVTQTTDIEDPFLEQGHKIQAEDFKNLLEDPHFSDLTLKVGKETFQVHKAILASRSSVFERMLKSDMKESEESIVEIAEMKPSIVKKMLQYIYTARVGKWTVDTAIDLYVGADRYDLQELKGWCKELILKRISSDDVCRVAVIADLHSDEELRKAARVVFNGNPKLIIGSQAWRDFRETNLTLYVDLLESSLTENQVLKISESLHIAL